MQNPRTFLTFLAGLQSWRFSGKARGRERFPLQGTCKQPLCSQTQTLLRSTTGKQQRNKQWQFPLFRYSPLNNPLASAVKIVSRSYLSIPLYKLFSIFVLASTYVFSNWRSLPHSRQGQSSPHMVDGKHVCLFGHGTHACSNSLPSDAKPASCTGCLGTQKNASLVFLVDINWFDYFFPIRYYFLLSTFALTSVSVTSYQRCSYLLSWNYLTLRRCSSFGVGFF